jgi:putative Ca2+/H+ antiporter (TMEM165/GDT1 family)
MHPFLVSTGVVALAEIGDKTQLLSLLLATRFRRPVPIIFGILLATAANHALAAAAGVWFTHAVSAGVLRWTLGLSFLGMAIWALIPDRLEERDDHYEHIGAFGASLIAFFLVEMGDKTQVATVALAAHYDAVLSVVMGTTLGMMIANIPAVLLGEAAATRLPTRLIRLAAATLFAVIGLTVLLGVHFGWERGTL